MQRTLPIFCFMVAMTLLLITTSASADLHNVYIATVPVGNLGNGGEGSGENYGGDGPDRICGSVDYPYNIGKYEVTAGQYTEFLNAVAGVDTYSLYNTAMWSSSNGCKIERFEGSGTVEDPYRYRVAADYANRPVNFVSWADAARFANWMHNGQPTGEQDLTTTEDGSYFLNGAVSSVELQAVVREPDATWVIPSEDEWYKAAYHKNDGVTSNYWDYPTCSDIRPSNDLIDPDPGNNANFEDDGYTIDSPYWRTEYGEFENSASCYGTYDQAGNVWELNESIIGEGRSTRGGAWDAHIQLRDYLHAADRASWAHPWSDEADHIGFRLAEIVHWPPCDLRGDLDLDGDVDLADLAALLAHYGETCD